MAIKYADEIIKDIKERGEIKVPDDCVTGEEYENWLYNESVKGNTLFSNPYDDSLWDGE